MEEGDKNPGMVIENVENFDNNELSMDKNAENSKENLENSNTATLKSIGNVVKNALSMFFRFFEPYWIDH